MNKHVRYFNFSYEIVGKVLVLRQQKCVKKTVLKNVLIILLIFSEITFESIVFIPN